jgi:ketosteroid isomerase-like protein
VSQENVEIVRRANEALNRGGVEAALEYLDPNIEYIPSAQWPEARVYKGYDGMREFQALWTEQFDQFRLDLERLIDAGDHVIALIYLRGHIKGTADQIEQLIGYDCEIRDGRLACMCVYSSWAEALKAVGLI